MNGQINLIEYEDKLVFSNKGFFIPGSIETVLENDCPEEVYRNRFLADAMVNLKLVDTIGSGIKNMYLRQRDRLFPLPVYDLSGNRVVVTIAGKIMDINYSNILAKNRNLSLKDIELLNRIQFGQKPSQEVASYLRKKGLIEGRMPNVYISKSLASSVGLKADYSRHKGIEESQCVSLLKDALKTHGAMSRIEIERLLWNVLSDVLDDAKKKNKISNLLKKMKNSGIIDNSGRNRMSSWFLVKTEEET